MLQTTMLGALVTEPASVAGVAPSLSLEGYGFALAALLMLVWALCERWERRASSKRNRELSSLLIQITEQHYRERVQAEERHLLAHDSSVRTVHEHLERMLLGKPKT